MPGLLPNVDPDGLLEYSVVYSDRSLNHMSLTFQEVMNDISASLRKVYNGAAAVVVPGSGTFGMEAVARQFAHDQSCFVVRNGWFSYRWSQIFEAGKIPAKEKVFVAKPNHTNKHAPFAPAALDELTAAIRSEKPNLVFAPHVETSAGMILPDDYLKTVAAAVHEVGGMFVLDCIASGTMWVDMQDVGVDVLISAPQKGWSASPCAGLVVLSQRALDHIPATNSSSFACDLKKWLQIMQAYENGGHAYHATMPTDGLTCFRNVMREIESFGLDTAKQRQQELGNRIRKLLEQNGLPSVAAEGFQAPGVVVSYTDDPEIKNGKKFKEQGVQIAAGVPLQCGEPADFQTFRLGLFGLDKLQNVDRTVASFQTALEKVVA